MVEIEDIVAAQRAVAGRLHRTPMMGSEHFSRESGCKIRFKLEMFQKTGSFKSRGAMNKMLSLDEATRRRGVIGISSGNHAQAMAWAAAQCGAAAVVVMPAWSTPYKVAATRGYGAEVVLTEDNLLERCAKLQEERNLTLVHPFDDPAIIAGAGTVGLEILEDAPDVDVVICGIGGGGLISGVASAIKGRRSEAKVYGVEPEGACAMTKSLAEGKPATLEKVETVADGLAAPWAGENTFEHVKHRVDEVVLVSDAEILEAMRAILERLKVVAEPSAAAGLAALRSGKIKPDAGANVVLVLSGGNINGERLKSLL
jgi:threonine dehydratase